MLHACRCPQEECALPLSAADCEALLSAGDWATLQALQAEAAIPESRKFYCPAPSCSAQIVVPADLPADGVAACPDCQKCAVLYYLTFCSIS